MKVFIDESGQFLESPTRNSSVSCAGALIIPDNIYPELIWDFKGLKAKWGMYHQEVKGSTLNEGEINDLLRVLMKYDLMLEIVAIDMNTQDDNLIIKHKNNQAEAMLANISQDHKSSLIEQIKKMRSILKSLPNQLYVQMFTFHCLMYHLIQRSSLYYSQRMPDELGNINFLVDAKDKKITPYEDLWHKTVLVFLQDVFLKRPLIVLEDADYTFFNKYFFKKNIEIPDDIPEHIKDYVYDNLTPGNDLMIINNNFVSENISFGHSHLYPGLELADILINTIRRAMNGKMDISGWNNIGKLMVQDHKQTILFVDLCNGAIKRHKKAPYVKFNEHIEKTKKPMITL
jgi:hypothetical protein